MSFSLRYYQREAIDAIYQSMREGVQSPLAVLPTGAGKSPVVGQICTDVVNRWNGSALVLVHVKELVAQLSDTVRWMWPDDYCPLGVMSAGLGQTAADRITIAGVQTLHKRLDQLPPIDVCIVDEAHMIPPDGEGMYRKCIKWLRTVNPQCRLVGLTATPYRTKEGRIDECGIFDRIVYDAPVTDLIEQGFLSKIVGKNGGNPDLSGVHSRGGDYIAGELESAMTDREKVDSAAAQIKAYAAGRRGVLIFCSGVIHAAMIHDALAEIMPGERIEIVTGETPNAERDTIIADYKAMRLRFLVNVNVLSTGFDAPHVDLVVLLRPTQSPGLYYQQVGRGFRLADGKTECVVLDMAGNMERHGPIQTLNERARGGRGNGDGTGEAPSKTCPECDTIVATAALSCEQCGYVFPPREIVKHKTSPDDGDPIYEAAPEWHEVYDVEYSEHIKRGADPGHPKTLRVSYYPPGIGQRPIASEWVCVEHPLGSYASNKATAWLRDRLPKWLPIGSDMTLNMPDEEPARVSAALIADPSICRYLRVPARILVAPDGKYQRVVDYQWESAPEVVSDQPNESPEHQPTIGELYNDDEIPF